MSSKTVCYEGIGTSLQDAMIAAHDQIPLNKPGRDYAVSKVVELGMQRGGITNERLYYVKVIEDEAAHPKSHGARNAAGGSGSVPTPF